MLQMPSHQETVIAAYSISVLIIWLFISQGCPKYGQWGSFTL